MNVKRTRSPNYPIIDLETAVQLAEKVYAYAKQHPVPLSAAAEQWELKAEGSQMGQYVAALRAFGLMDVEGEGNQRKVRVTEDGAKIILDHPDRRAILREAALKPKIHRMVWSQANEQGLPPDATIRNYLVFDLKPPFNDKSVGAFLRQFRRTIGFAGLDFTAEEPVEYEREQPENQPRIVEKRESRVTGAATIVAPSESPGTRQDVFSLDEGPVILQWPEHLSKASFEDFEGWINLVLRKVKRSVGVAGPQGQVDSDTDDEDLVG